ncbi:MAG: alanine--tRNA ligase [Spongiibacteraceae bacterium]|nr:alanine--tRNA ligase [Spongiibacteraceae bacterium]
MKSSEIREAFLRYFEQQGHARVGSSSLVPVNDPTLLFTNAGMVQFKEVFLGQDKRAYTRATSSQRCVRAGGKHDDLENVGYTARHHTFFEMLGNFSFGDYFKRDAIQFAWAFLTEVLQLPEERLWVTVHVSDDEAADIWQKEIGVSKARFSRLDEDNFWQMGDTGPCGPSSEIFYDHGDDIPGGPPGSENDDLDRYIEIRNLVFMQYNRDSKGELHPLPKPSVDTGMGMERIAAVMQGVHNNYDIDLFQQLLKAAAQLIGCDDINHTSLRVIADHIRSCSFMVADGVLPSNEGRGYVLRRIIRRAVRHGNKLGASEPFFHKLVAALAKEMGEAYPELLKLQAQIEKVLLTEEQQFAKTLDQGTRILEQDLQALKGSVIPGEIIFKLYDTYGFPSDLTGDIARERNLSLDEAGFEREMERQRQRARGASNFTMALAEGVSIEGQTTFTGYQQLSDQGEITALLKDGEFVKQLSEGESGVVVLASTPFYGESGGQAGDCGYMQNLPGQTSVRFEVSDTTKNHDNCLHHGVMSQGVLRVGDSLALTVDPQIRQATKLNHSATHLLHAALRKVLGEHVTQKGSLVDAQKLRFDFSHFEALNSQQVRHIESLVNEKIRLNTLVQTTVTDMDNAKTLGAMMLFGEKYSDEVRVLAMADGFSVEPCGGTHVSRTGDIGLVRIVSESGIASGIRRIEAVSGKKALAVFDETEQCVADIASLLKGSKETVKDKVQHLLDNHKQLEKELAQLKVKMARSAGSDLASQAVEVNGVKVLAAVVEGANAKSLRDTVDQLKNKLGSAVVLLAAVEGDKISLTAGVSKDVTDRFKAGELMREVASKVGGKGGGRPDMAQGGGNNPAALNDALASVKNWVSSK